MAGRATLSTTRDTVTIEGREKEAFPVANSLIAVQSKWAED
ncbi:Uncharacterised protein [Legionella spiritensis]|nr:Uncharacterised protein [Legionella spiritensis]